jgi:hypothetical protein
VGCLFTSVRVARELERLVRQATNLGRPAHISFIPTITRISGNFPPLPWKTP